jgi:hypothetical protein
VHRHENTVTFHRRISAECRRRLLRALTHAPAGALVRVLVASWASAACAANRQRHSVTLH